jgi:hypothetical protein
LLSPIKAGQTAALRSQYRVGNGAQKIPSSVLRLLRVNLFAGWQAEGGNFAIHTKAIQNAGCVITREYELPLPCAFARFGRASATRRIADGDGVSPSHHGWPPRTREETTLILIELRREKSASYAHYVRTINNSVQVKILGSGTRSAPYGWADPCSMKPRAAFWKATR